MFEQEIQMEKRESSIVPLVLIVTLIVAIVGVALYFVAESRKVLTPAEATPLIQQILDGQPPASVRFETGTIRNSEKPRDPNYRLLEKAGYLNIGKETKSGTPVQLTTQGRAFLDDVAGVKKGKAKDGNDEYILPLGQRKLVALGKITMETPSRAVVEYTWEWQTTKAGELFDASGPLVKAFNTWDRQTLIDKYGANFYHEGPSKVALSLLKTEKGWQPNTE